jgi:hypothetical protein
LDQSKFLFQLLDTLEEIKSDLEFDYGTDDVAYSKIKNLMEFVEEYKEEVDG